jgi:hypothetical protein
MNAFKTPLKRTSHRHIGLDNLEPQLQFSLHDKAHCAMPGLFTSLTKSSKLEYDIEPYQHGDVTLSVKGPRMGVFEGRVLQTLIATASKNKVIKDTDDGHCLYIPNIHLAEICRELGLAYHFDSVTLIRSALSKMHEVKLKYQYSTTERISRSGNKVVNKKTLETGIIYKIETNETDFSNKDGEIKTKIDSIGILLNRRITDVIMSSSSTGYARIELDEARFLKDPAWSIHQRLCAFIDPGKVSFPIGIDALCEYAWGSPVGLTPEATRKRRSLVRKSLAEFLQIGWKVTETKKKFVFERPALAHRHFVTDGNEDSFL